MQAASFIGLTGKVAKVEDMLFSLLRRQEVNVGSMEGTTLRWVTAHSFGQILDEKAAEERKRQN